MPVTTQAGGWLLAGRLLGLIAQSGFSSLRQAADHIGIDYTVLWHAIHDRQPMRKTLTRILDGLDATEEDLLNAPDLPLDTKLSVHGRKPKTD